MQTPATVLVNTKAGSNDERTECVSCPTTTSCIAVANLEGGGARVWRLSKPASEWFPTYETTPTPSGGSKAQLKGISCSSETVWTAVGSYYVEKRKNIQTADAALERIQLVDPNAASLTESSAIEEVGVSCSS